jgi:hypothetical protein
MNTSATGAVPSLPPMYRSFVPYWIAAPSVRPAGSEIFSGEGCQASIAPTGAGHGSSPFSAGQRLIGVT